MLSTPNTAPVGSPREFENGGSAWNARYRYDEPSTRTRSGRFGMSYFLGGDAPFFFALSSGLSGAVTSGAGDAGVSGESTLCGEFDVSGVAPGSGVCVGRVAMSRAPPGR